MTVAPRTVAATALVGVPDEVREPSGRRIDVDARVEDVAALPEDLLRAVALVGVDVDDRDPFDTAVAQSLGGRRGVVEVARPAEERGPGVVTRRAHRRVRRARCPPSTRSLAWTAAWTAEQAASNVPSLMSDIVSIAYRPTSARIVAGRHPATYLAA